ncbi:hypothetical protein BB559_003926 [Furculomyces boomerangus]|uniref:Uncharacterized protein n=1 Tax=Furculomyces boomerangus TaxID=61424 RepID=A0A2T9YHY9_9FUNG|nr:hypothetical protein BB559_003926 [Furculomyces boomerangus]
MTSTTNCYFTPSILRTYSTVYNKDKSFTGFDTDNSLSDLQNRLHLLWDKFFLFDNYLSDFEEILKPNIHALSHGEPSNISENHFLGLNETIFEAAIDILEKTNWKNVLFSDPNLYAKLLRNFTARIILYFDVGSETNSPSFPESCAKLFYSYKHSNLNFVIQNSFDQNLLTLKSKEPLELKNNLNTLLSNLDTIFTLKNVFIQYLKKEKDVREERKLGCLLELKKISDSLYLCLVKSRQKNVGNAKNEKSIKEIEIAVHKLSIMLIFSLKNIKKNTLEFSIDSKTTDQQLSNGDSSPRESYRYLDELRQKYAACYDTTSEKMTKLLDYIHPFDGYIATSEKSAEKLDVEFNFAKTDMIDGPNIGITGGRKNSGTKGRNKAHRKSTNVGSNFLGNPLNSSNNKNVKLCFGKPKLVMESIQLVLSKTPLTFTDKQLANLWREMISTWLPFFKDKKDGALNEYYPDSKNLFPKNISRESILAPEDVKAFQYTISSQNSQSNTQTQTSLQYQIKLPQVPQNIEEIVSILPTLVHIVLLLLLDITDSLCEYRIESNYHDINKCHCIFEFDYNLLFSNNVVLSDMPKSVLNYSSLNFVKQEHGLAGKSHKTNRIAFEQLYLAGSIIVDTLAVIDSFDYLMGEIWTQLLFDHNIASIFFNIVGCVELSLLFPEEKGSSDVCNFFYSEDVPLKIEKAGYIFGQATCEFYSAF